MTAVAVPLAFLGGAVGPAELILIFIVVLLLFGPKRLPEIAKTIGKVMNEMRRASRDFQDQIMKIEEELPKGDVSSVISELTEPAALPPAPPSDSGWEPPPQEEVVESESEPEPEAPLVYEKPLDDLAQEDGGQPGQPGQQDAPPAPDEKQEPGQHGLAG
jgi:sec-independent protein translocase protein TatA